MKGKKPVIGITGGIASGKSLVARILAELGAGVIDADELNHQVLARDAVKRQVQLWWGPQMFQPDGRLDRRRLADVVFQDDRQKARLEGLTHPLIEDLRRQIMAGLQSDERVNAIVLDTPLLFEVGQDQLCDVIIFVDADDEVRRARARHCRGWTQEELRRRENLQNPLDTKRQKSDYIVTNNSDIEALRQRVKAVHQLVTST